MSEPLARIESESRDRTLQLTVSGEIDLSNAATLQAQIKAHIAEADPQRVIIDLSRVEYLDSQGMMLLLEIASTLLERETPLELVAPAGSVAADLLALSHLQDLPVERLSDR
jgi:anti-sigma B factor antagonist